MKWLPLHIRRQLHMATYMHKIIHNKAPSQFGEKFNYVSGGSRSGENCNLYLPKSKSHKEFTFTGAKCWNSVPNKLRNINDHKIFSKIYKQYLLFSILNNPNYKLENSFDYFYKIIDVNE